MPQENHHIFVDGELSRSEDTLRIYTLDGEIKYLPVESVGTIYLHGQIVPTLSTGRCLVSPSRVSMRSVSSLRDSSPSAKMWWFSCGMGYNQQMS